MVAKMPMVERTAAFMMSDFREVGMYVVVSIQISS